MRAWLEILRERTGREWIEDVDRAANAGKLGGGSESDRSLEADEAGGLGADRPARTANRADHRSRLSLGLWGLDGCLNLRVPGIYRGVALSATIGGLSVSETEKPQPPDDDEGGKPS